MVHDVDGDRSQYKAQSVIMGLSFNITFQDQNSSREFTFARNGFIYPASSTPKAKMKKVSALP